MIICKFVLAVILYIIIICKSLLVRYALGGAIYKLYWISTRPAYRTSTISTRSDVLRGALGAWAGAAPGEGDGSRVTLAWRGACLHGVIL